MEKLTTLVKELKLRQVLSADGRQALHPALKLGNKGENQDDIDLLPHSNVALHLLLSHLSYVVI